jgi:hypothetical protein
MYLRALASYEKASTLDTINNLGTPYVDHGELNEVEEMCRRVLEGYE